MSKQRRLRLAIGLVCAAAVCAGAVAWYSTRLPKRFAAVVDGQLYRSGSVSPGQLARLRDDYGIARIICLLNPQAAVTQQERAEAERLGIEWRNVPLPGNGASTPEERAEILRLMGEPARGATLVHCAAGVNRTGLAVGLYRLYREGWPLERVIAEMERFGFEDDARHECVREALTSEAAHIAAAMPSSSATRPTP